MNAIADVVNGAVLRLKWTEAEGGRILDALPMHPLWAFVEVLISRADVQRLRQGSSCLVRWESYFADPLRARAQDLLAAVTGVPLALGSEWEKWMDEDGSLFHLHWDSDTFVAYYGVPTQAWADARAERLRQWEADAEADRAARAEGGK